MIRKATTCLLLAAVARTQQTVVQDLKNWLLSAAMLSFFALSVDANIDRHTPNQTIRDTSQPQKLSTHLTVVVVSTLYHARSLIAITHMVIPRLKLSVD